MARRKYQFSSRQEAEDACQKESRVSLRYHWLVMALTRLVMALTTGRIKWTRKAGDYRFASFVPNPGRSCEALIVEEFHPDTGQSPSFYVYDSEEFRQREMEMLRFNDSESETWLRSAERVREQVGELLQVEA